MGFERRGPHQRGPGIDGLAEVVVPVIATADGEIQLRPQIDLGLQVSGHDVARSRPVWVAEGGLGHGIYPTQTCAGHGVLGGEPTGIRQPVECIGPAGEKAGFDPGLGQQAPLEIDVGAQRPGAPEQSSYRQSAG